MHTRGIGARYEEAAAEYLIAKGYTIVQRNVTTPYGEIDIVAKDGSVMVFCEVKYRSSSKLGAPLEAVDGRKQRRISRAALYFLACQEREPACRFDVIGIGRDGGITHIENAFDFKQ